MTSDVENLTRFYANLPSIFGTDSTSNLIESSSNTFIDNDKTYQPMFGSFLFADSEPLTRAAFVASTSSSIEMKSTEEEQTDEASTLKANYIPTKEPSPLALVEDISDIDDDDFDGIPIRHASSIGTEILNHDNHLLDQLAHDDDDDGDDDDDEEDLFLNGFTDEQQQQHNTIPSLFNNIPDIDDLNEHEEDNDDDRIPFDHMDMLDQSDSIRSSSPDSVLSSSHLRDDDDYDDEDMNNHDDEDDVTQWNDDDILGKITSQNNRPNAPLPPPIVLNIHSDDQVNFIDSSRSNSRCSTASSHLSIGYADQAQIFINDDDELVSPSDSDDDDRIHWENDRLTRENSDEEPSLQVNLDYPRSRSSSSNHSDNSPRSISPSILDQSPILAIDDDANESKKEFQSAPIANVDDEDDEDLPIFSSDQPVLSPIPFKNLFELRNEYRQNDIIHDIINMRHIINEHDNDDEFVAIMHNPTVFEEVLYDHDDEQQKSALIKQTNNLSTTFQTSSQLSIENESFKHYQNIQQTPSLLSVSINEKNSPSNIRTTNYSSPTAVNHLPIGEEEKEEKENVDVVNRSSIKLKKTQQSLDENTANINIKQITNGEEKRQDHYQMMSSNDDDDDDQSDNDSELLKTLAQLHGLVHQPSLSTDIYNSQISSCKQDENTNLNLDKKQNLILSNDVDKNHPSNEEQKSSTFFSLTSLTSSTLFNDDESHSTDIMIDSNASSSLTMSNSEYNNLFDNEVRLIVEKLVSDILQLALDQLNESSQSIEYFVEQILSEAVYQVYAEDNHLSTENLVSIINWHHENDKKILDPFDQECHNIWINHFQTPDDNINPIAFHSNTFDELNLFSLESNQADFIQKEIASAPLFINPSNPDRTDKDSMKSPLTAVVNNSSFQYKTEPAVVNDENIDPSSTENQDDTTTTPEVELRTSINENDNQPTKYESFLENQPRLSQFDEFASDHPLNTPGRESIVSEIDRQFDESLQKIRKSTDTDNEPWELEDNSEENLKPMPTSVTQNQDLYNKYFPDNRISTSEPVAPLTTITIDEESEDEDNNDEAKKENYDDYFSKYETPKNSQLVESPTLKSVRFSDKLPNVAVLTPKQSINLSESSKSTSTNDSDETDDDDEDKTTNHDQINENETNDHQLPDVIMRNNTSRPESNVSITESVDLPPPLPPLPPLNNKPLTTIDKIPSKSTLGSSSSNQDLKNKINSRSQANPTTTSQTPTYTRLHNNTDSQLVQSNESAILRSISKDNPNIDSDEVGDVISCVIDNNPIDIDAKTISPFKCIIGSAGQIDQESQTTIIALYGCWLPDHRLREYRYIMDQLFYYVYHKLEKLVSNDYVLVYFHGATPKHRTPDLKFLRKCYQMINFRLRKNLRAVYVVHPTRWLRTIIALSRPFFSNKFYHKVHYIFTIAELERQFPQNRITIPVIIEQHEKIYRVQ
jgi:prune family protein 2